MKLRVYLEPDEDGIFVATCPALPGCVSQGQTRVEAMEKIREAIEIHTIPIGPQSTRSLNSRYRGMLYINRICRSTWSPLNSTGSDGNGFDALIAATAASFSALEFDCPL